MSDRDRLAMLPLLALAFPITACLNAPKVLQGTVASYDPAAQRLVVLTPGPPPGRIEFSVAGAEKGADPLPGDTVRVAYREHQGGQRATRVMNVTRQDEKGKKGAKGSGGH